MERIHQAAVWQEITAKGNPFSFVYAKKDGTLARYNNAIASSIHSKGATINVILDGDSKPKTFRRVCFTEFNGKKIFI